MATVREAGGRILRGIATRLSSKQRGRRGHMGERVVKGSHVIAAESWVDARLGGGTFRDLTKKAGDKWNIPLPIAWYEVDVLHTALEEVARRLDRSVEDIAAEVARLNAESDLRSIYKIFMRVAQPHLVLSQTPRLWSTYVKFGSAWAVKNEKGHYVGQGDGFDERVLGWACGCWFGFIPTAITIAGGRVDSSRIAKRWRQSDGTYSLQLEVLYQ